MADPEQSANICRPVRHIAVVSSWQRLQDRSARGSGQQLYLYGSRKASPLHWSPELGPEHLHNQFILLRRGIDGDHPHAPIAAVRLVWMITIDPTRSEEHTSELQSRVELVCRLLLE